mgnify:CR=1 FL=1
MQNGLTEAINLDDYIQAPVKPIAPIDVGSPRVAAWEAESPATP